MTADLLILYALQGAYILLKTEGEITTGISYNFEKDADRESFLKISKLVTPAMFSQKKKNKVSNYKAYALKYHLTNSEDKESFNCIKAALQIA